LARARAEGGLDTREESLPARGRMAVPCRWGESSLGEFSGRVRMRRRFGWPGRIDAQERIWLTFGGVEGAAAVSLNGQLLGHHARSSEPFEFEITPLLRVRNELTVEVEAQGGSGGIWGEVALEVRATAFLKDVRFSDNRDGPCARLHVTGRLVGTCDRPLELYVLLDRKTLIYATLDALPEGQAFTLKSDDRLIPEPGRSCEVRVELVNGATVWYVVEETFQFQEQ
jgi:hypothetical protein